MLQEGFFETVDKETVELQIVDKMEGSSSYNEIKIVDGVLIIRAPPTQWGVNTNAAAEKLLNML